MTQPVQEPSTDRSLSASRWGNNQLFRRPAPPAATGGEMSWMTVYDDQPLGYAYATSSGNVSLQFPYIDWSDNALVADGGPFSYTTESGTTKFGKTYAYIVNVNVDGIYAITLSVICEDMNPTKDFKIKSGISYSGKYPGRQSGDPTLWAGESVLNLDFSTGYFYYERTWVLPLNMAGTTPRTIHPVFGIQTASAEVGSKNFTLRNKMWVTYLSEDHYAATNYLTSHDPGPP